MIKSGRLQEAWGAVQPTKVFLERSLSLVEIELTSIVTRAKAWDDEHK